MSTRFASRRIAAVLLLGALGLSASIVASAAVAAPSPESGPTAGGTSVTINGINFTQVVSGQRHGLGLTADGLVYAWGRNTEGQLGNGGSTNSAVPVAVKGVGGAGLLTGVIDISAGSDYSMAVTSTGVFAWGLNSKGQLGNGTTTSSSTPVQVLGVGGSGTLSGVTKISAGQSSATPPKVTSLALTSTGEVFAWGYNLDGQVGDGSPGADRLTPAKVLAVGGTPGTALSDVTAIDSGDGFSIALTPNGVFSWGVNNQGQLGDGSTANSPTPVQVKSVGGSGFLSDISSVAAGNSHSLALTNTGSVLAWGYDNAEQLGNPAIVSTTSTPVAVSGVGGTGSLSGVSKIFAANLQSFALVADGMLAWGNNNVNQLGDGTTTNRASPIYTKGVGGTGRLTDVISVAGGFNHTSVLTPSGVYSWGVSTAGQMGAGDFASSVYPILGPNFQAVSVSFAGVAGTDLSASNGAWTVTTPAGTAGTVEVLATAKLFGGSVAAGVPDVAQSAGTFTFVAPAGTPGGTTASLPRTGSEPSRLIGPAALMLLAGVIGALARSRERRQS